MGQSYELKQVEKGIEWSNKNAESDKIKETNIVARLPQNQTQRRMSECLQNAWRFRGEPESISGKHFAKRMAFP